MNKKEFDKKYVGENIAVNCKTKELAEEFMSVARKYGHTWCSLESLEDENWGTYKENTAYRYQFAGVYTGFVYGNIKSFARDNYKVIEFNGFSTHDEYKLIVNEDKGTIVLINKDNNKGISKCLPSDKFDLGFGVKLAKAKLDRNQGEVKRLIELSNKLSKNELYVNLNISLNDEIIKAQIEKTKADIEKKFDEMKTQMIKDFEKSIIDGLKIDMGKNDDNGLDNLKVGDTVLIRKDLVVGDAYSKYENRIVSDTMSKFIGTSVIIDLIDFDVWGTYFKVQGSENFWTKEMFEKKL